MQKISNKIISLFLIIVFIIGCSKLSDINFSYNFADHIEEASIQGKSFQSPDSYYKTVNSDIYQKNVLREGTNFYPIMLNKNEEKLF